MSDYTAEDRAAVKQNIRVWLRRFDATKPADEVMEKMCNGVLKEFGVSRRGAVSVAAHRAMVGDNQRTPRDKQKALVVGMLVYQHVYRGMALGHDQYAVTVELTARLFGWEPSSDEIRQMADLALKGVVTRSQEKATNGKSLVGIILKRAGIR